MKILSREKSTSMSSKDTRLKKTGNKLRGVSDDNTTHF